MLQALYSRSPKSVREHLKQVKKSGPEKFMSKFYVGYGHKSIGDCGTTSIFIENVSMLVAKAVQDNPLYSGQEASTRYLNMADQPIVNPAGTARGEEIQLEWIALYKKVLATLIPLFETRFPREEGQKESIWRKAVKARAFDVARGFLPAGCTTYVAWHTNLRQAADHLKLMRHSRCAEIRETASRIQRALEDRYPSSFSPKRYDEQEIYLAKSAGRFAFYNETPVSLSYASSQEFFAVPYLNMTALQRPDIQHLLETRPPKTELHHRFRRFGYIDFEFPLDFGSYRDFQRHRSCVQEMPLLTTDYGIMGWYLHQLPDDLREEVCRVAERQEQAILGLNLPVQEKQYYVAMSYICPIKVACNLPSAVYIAELRSGTTVHPTVRKIAHQIGDTLERLIPGIALHLDRSEGVWDIKRGAQDIVEVGNDG